jgi:hypothetical protein
LFLPRKYFIGADVGQCYKLNWVLNVWKRARTTRRKENQQKKAYTTGREDL